MVFFYHSNKVITDTFGILFDKPEEIEVAAGVGTLSEQLGYYSFLKQVADTGKFTIAGKTAIQSAYIADLWEVLMYLAAEKAQHDYQERLRKEYERRAKK